MCLPLMSDTEELLTVSCVSYCTAIVKQEDLLEFIAVTLVSRPVSTEEVKACLHMLICRYHTVCSYN
jgi:hypothetical protein